MMLDFHNLRRFLVYTVLATCLAVWQPATAAQYTLAVQPILSKDRTEAFYAPLAAFLSQATGHEIRVISSHNFVAYWALVRSGEQIDMALDPAHFTGYRIQHQDYEVLLKILDTLSFSLVTNEDNLLFDASELVGKSVATSAPPSLGGIELQRLYPHLMRQPIVVGTNTFDEALQRLRQNQVTAALLPTPMVNGDLSLNTIATTEPVPHLALSVSPRVDADTRDNIRRALLEASNNPQGQALFNRLNLSGFEPASNAQYRPYGQLLENTWGY